MKLKTTRIAALVGMAISQYAVGASMTVTGDIYSKVPAVKTNPQGTLYEGVKESVVKLSTDNDGCRVLYSPTTTAPSGVVGCYLSVLDKDLPVGMVYKPLDGSLVGFASQKGDMSVPYEIYYRSGSAQTAVKVGSGFLPFRIVGTVPPVITGIAGKFDKSSWLDGKEPQIHKRQATGALKVSVEPRPFDQKVVIDQFSNCTVTEGADNCVATNSSMVNVRGTDDVGSKVMAVDVNSSNSYFAPVLDQVALSWDFRPPVVGDSIHGNLQDPLAEIKTASGTQTVPFSFLAALINSPHNDPKDDWWNPDSIKLRLAPDLNTKRKIYLSYKGKTLFSVAATTHDNTTVSVKPKGNWVKTGTQQFRYDFDLSDVKDADFLATMEVTDKYGNTSTSAEKAIRLDRYAPVVGLFAADLTGVVENESVFFPERLVVAAHNGYDDGLKKVSAKFGPVDLQLTATDTPGVFTIAKGDYSKLVPGNTYQVVVSATDKSDRTTTKTYSVRYAATDLSFNSTPANPVQFVQRSVVKISTSGYQCPMAFDEDKALAAAALNGKVYCFAEWKLPTGINASVNELGKLTLEGFIEQETGLVEYTLMAVSPEGAKMTVRKGTFDIAPKAVDKPEISFNGRRMQGDNGFMVDNKGGAAGSVIVTSSPGDLEVAVNVTGITNTTNTVVMRPRSNGQPSKTSQLIKVPKSDIWSVFPIKVQAKYKRTDKISAEKEGKIYIVPSKQVRITLEGLDRESANTSTTDITSKVGIYDSKTNKVNYSAGDHGEWIMGLVQEVVTREKGAVTKTLVPISDKIKTDANGEAKLVFDPDKTTGRAVTYMVVGDVISPFDNFSLQIKSRKQRVSLIKGVGVDGTPSNIEIVDRVPMKADIKIRPDSQDDKKALGQVEWQIREGDSGEWTTAPNATARATYTFQTAVAGKWQVRAILHNRVTGVTKPTDITTLVAYERPEIKLVQDNVAIKGQPVTLTVAGDHGANIDDALNVQWSTDGKTWVDGDVTNEILPAADSNYIYARAEFASTEDEAKDKSWVTTKIMPRTIMPKPIRANVEGPDKAEIQKELTLKGSFKNDYQLVKDVKFVEEWVLPDGSTAEGNELKYTPTEASKSLQFIYRVWVDGFKDATIKEVKKTIDTWSYNFPRFLSSQRQYFKLAPTTIEIRNTSLLPNTPGVTFNFEVMPTPGVEQVSFKDGRYIAQIKEPGIYNIQVKLSDNRGNVETKELLFAVDEAIPMQASLTPSFSNKFMREPLNVTMNSSIDLDHPSDKLTEYGWSLDGVDVTDPIRRQMFAGLKAGQHTIVFNAVSEFGQRASLNYEFTVNPNTPPECELQPSYTRASVNLKMSCKDADGKMVAYRWRINGQGVSNTSYAVSLTKALNPWPLEVEAVGVDDSGDETSVKMTLTGQ